jgi:excisionase family DNA binding protein
MLSIQQAAMALNVSVSTIQRLIRSGKLESVKIMKCRRIKDSSLRQLMEKGTSR